MSSGLALEAEGGRWKRYPAYRDSGVEWLGVVPEEWDVLRLKNVAHFGYGNSLAADERVPGDYYVYGSNGIVGRHEQPNTEGPCLIIGRKGSFGKVAYSKKSCFVIDTTYFVDSTLTNNNLRWLYYCLQWLQLDSFTKDSAVPGLSREDAYENRVPFCSIDEQRTIAAFLDRETGRIDALIAKKGRQIELLQEKRAVTKGLDPDAPMKDSGIEWLGEVPEHWTVAPLYARYQVRLGKMLDGKRITGAHLAPYLRNVNVQWGKVDVSDLPMMDFLPSERVRLSLQKGDLLACEGGEVGRTAIWGGEIDECYYQKAIHRLRPQNETDYNRFFYYVMFMAAHIGVFAAGADISTIGHLTAEKLRKHRFVFPPKKEQHEIADYLDGATPKITGIVEYVSDSIDKLREYRTALISAAVTGKIDVREELVS